MKAPLPPTETERRDVAELRATVVRLQESEERLRGSEQRYHALFEHAPDGIVIADPHSVYLDANASICRMLGYAREELIGLQASDIVAPAEIAQIEPALRAIRARPYYHREWQFRRKDGSTFAAEVIVATMTDGNLLAMIRDITARKLAEAALAKAHQELVAASRQAGMAEVATGVLHNVGNVLNSVNVSATLIADQVRRSKGANVAKLAALVTEHRADLAAFLTTDPRGQMIPGYLATLTESLAQERVALLAELDHLRKNVGHIKDIVGMQQSYARTSGGVEPVALVELVEDGLRMNASSLARHDVELVRDFQVRPMVSADKHKIMQIVVNLVRNAQLACDEGGRPNKRIVVRIAGDAQRVRVSVSDNGIGIPAENLTRIFAHGFTTRKDGHGFGLHSGALAAKELGGSLTVQSDGPGHGATFILELPVNPDPSPHENSAR